MYQQQNKTNINKKTQINTPVKENLKQTKMDPKKKKTSEKNKKKNSILYHIG
jgi:hypothetical protein